MKDANGVELEVGMEVYNLASAVSDDEQERRGLPKIVSIGEDAVILDDGSVVCLNVRRGKVALVAK